MLRVAILKMHEEEIENTAAETIHEKCIQLQTHCNHENRYQSFLFSKKLQEKLKRKRIFECIDFIFDIFYKMKEKKLTINFEKY